MIMKRLVKFKMILFSLSILSMLFVSCNEKAKGNTVETSMNTSMDVDLVKTPAKKLSEDFKKYWYAGDAEITSYQLEQARYGEIREGKAVLIYVTEPFLADKQVKADRNNPSNIPVLKLNSTKKYLTGIYPYSIMGSTFYPVSDNQHAVKVSASVQEWCGHVYAQINNRTQFEFTSHSYFESEADQQTSLEKAVLENELWNKIRINPENLPLGTFKAIPSLEYVRLRHKELKAYDAIAKSTKEGEITTYTLSYPSLERSLSIRYTTAFPYTIESWEESFKSGFGANAKTLISKATKLKQLKTPYWGQNRNKHLVLRDSLGL